MKLIELLTWLGVAYLLLAAIFGWPPLDYLPW